MFFKGLTVQIKLKEELKRSITITSNLDIKIFTDKHDLEILKYQSSCFNILSIRDNV